MLLEDREPPVEGVDELPRLGEVQTYDHRCIDEVGLIEGKPQQVLVICLTFQLPNTNSGDRVICAKKRSKRGNGSATQGKLPTAMHLIARAWL